jgi:(R,R)-butanediol dehydrogenase/meso-butanediol dehydrogenase/diacetyl reductase
LKALRWHGRKDLRLEDVDRPQPGEGEVLVAVTCCGICGSDLHEYAEGPIFIPVDSPPGTGRMAPVTLGHEFVGRIAELGPGAPVCAIGERVIVDACLRCGECWYCSGGEPMLCEKLGFLGMMQDGAFAQYVLAPAALVHPVPDSVTDEEAALVEPLSVGLRGVRRSGLKAGDTAVVVGAGPIGLGVVAMARRAGAGAVFVVERAEARRQKALEMGATEAFDPDWGDAAEQVRAATPGGRGADVAFECVGHSDPLNVAIQSSRPGGTVAVLGVFGAPATVDFNQVMAVQRTLVGSLGYVEDYPRVLRLLASGQLDVGPLITARIHLEDAVTSGFDELLRNQGQHVKILVAP